MLCDFFIYLQVAERALFLWNNDHIEGLIKQNSKVILPIVLPALERNTKGHWNQAVQSLSLNVRKIFTDHDPTLFEECRKKFEEDEAQEASMRSKREARWKRLEELAVSKSTQWAEQLTEASPSAGFPFPVFLTAYKQLFPAGSGSTSDVSDHGWLSAVCYLFLNVAAAV
jgi:hypothetical protein